MSVLKFISSNAKRIVGCSLLLSLMAVQSVGAAGSSIELKSKGNIEYDSNKDGTPDVLFYSKDLTTISEGIDDINGNMVILSQSFDDLANASAGYKSDIIAGLNSNVYAKNNIAADSSFEDIISKINNIPAPTTATGNVWSSGDNTGIGITANGQSVDIDGVTSLNLAVNESITLPSGYYPNDITISNNVANRGSTQSYMLTSSEKSKTFPEGYYDSFTVFAEIPDIPDVSLTYTHHVHSTSSTTESIENDSQDRDSIGTALADSYQAPSAGGCFTTPYYYIPAYNTSEPIYCYGAEHPYWSNVTNCNECPVCTNGFHGTDRKYLGQRTTTIPAHWSSINENNMATVINYTRSCGYSSGEVTDLHIHY